MQLISSYLHGTEKAITESSVEEMLKSIAVGDLTTQEVLRAFCHRTSLAHQLVVISSSYLQHCSAFCPYFYTKCLSEIRFQSASKYARELDGYWREHRRPIGPLHGLPISVMDRFYVDGLESACGLASWLGQIKNADDEGVLIKTLRKLGAIVFC